MLEDVDGESRSYLEIAEVIQAVSAEPVANLHELWRRIAFSILVSNSDDHLRNHGFVRDVADPGWYLSPAFDINPNPIAPGQLSTAIDETDHSADVDLLMHVSDWFRLHGGSWRRSSARRVPGVKPRPA